MKDKTIALRGTAGEIKEFLNRIAKENPGMTLEEYIKKTEKAQKRGDA